MKKTAAGITTLLVMLCALPLLYAQGVNPYPSGNPTESAPQTASQLQGLVAPIALYPDSLVAQVLTASTFPDQVAIADYWMQENTSLTGSALMQAVDKQSWNAAVKGLTQFPSVLHNMATNLSWTSSLGEAYHNQQTEVMSAIQKLRAQAQSAGNLNSSSQIKVVQQSPDVIVIQPANPQIVYVPQYNPAVIYGVPYVTPGYTPGEMAAASVMSFGVGVAVGSMMHGGCCAWGYSSWNCGWHGTAVVYHGGAYYGNPAWHGGYYNSAYHPSYGYGNAYSHNYTDYDHTNVNRNVSGNTVNFNQADHSSFSNSWSQHSNGGSGAFSGYGGHSDAGGGSGGDDGWASRADSSRGWGSMRSSGYGGGRFGGFGGSGGGRWGRR